MRVIVMTACNRPVYTKRVIEALQRCRGIDEHVLLVRAEPGFPAVLEVLQSYRYPMHLTVNPKRLGCSANTIAAINAGFAAADWVVAVEDDTVPAVDALEFMSWASDRASLASCYRGPNNSDKGNRTGTLWDRWFFPWVWGIQRDLWERHWRHIIPESGRSWDTQLNDSLRRRGELVQLVPAWSRSHNIGAEGGAHVTDPAWHEIHMANYDWIGEGKIGKHEWDEPGPKPATEVIRHVPSWRRR
jgi:hypothetical protein